MTSATISRVHVATVLAMCLGLAALPPTARAQDQDEAFKDGLEAREAKKWQEVVTHMKRAIQADGQESPRRIRRGLGGILGGGTEYLPYFYLGEALFYQSDCVGAIDAWSVSERQGAVRSRSESVAAMQKGYAACEAKGVLPPVKYDPLLSRTRQQVTEATTLATRVDALRQRHTDLWRPEIREQYGRANADLQAAHSRLNTGTRARSEREFTEAAALAERARSALKILESQLAGAIALQATIQELRKGIDQALGEGDAAEKTLAEKKAYLTASLANALKAAHDQMARARSQMTEGLRAFSEPALSEARTMAQDAVVRYRALLDEVTRIETRAREKRVADAAALAQESFSFVDGGLASLTRLAEEKPSSIPPQMAEERTAIETQLAAARRRFNAARQRNDVAGLHEAASVATGLRGRVDTLIASFGPVTIVDRGVRPALAEGARLFFAGEHEQALAALASGSLTDVPLQLHVHLLRAAAHFALYVRSGERNASHREQALAEVGKVKELNSDFQPDERAFAPRFISFFRTGNASQPGPAAASSKH
jgi:hypothetical protein